jgi:hypothetical protein
MQHWGYVKPQCNDIDNISLMNNNMQSSPCPTTYRTATSTAATNITPAAAALFSTPHTNANANAYTISAASTAAAAASTPSFSNTGPCCDW